jgi:sporulation protein YlmC with PRC-barrel domain
MVGRVVRRLAVVLPRLTDFSVFLGTEAAVFTERFMGVCFLCQNLFALCDEFRLRTENCGTRLAEREGLSGGDFKIFYRSNAMRVHSIVAVGACGLCLALLSGGKVLAADQTGGINVHVDTGQPSEHSEKMLPSSGNAIRARDLTGVAVYNRDNERLGKIEDLVLDPKTGNIRYAVLSFGGILGMGEKMFAVPWQDLTMVTKGETSKGTEKVDYYTLDIRKDALKNAPGFDKSAWPDFADQKFIADINQFYGTQREARTTRGSTR